MGNQLQIRWMDETDSTQEEVRRHIPDYDNLSVTAACYQTSGRGQRGNAWLSRKGENLTFSMLLKFGGGCFPRLKATDQFLITRAATLGVTGYLESRDIAAAIKWPNDIYIGRRKVCGMLVENILEGGNVACSIVGIGLNVNQRIFPGELPNPTSMALQTGLEYDLPLELEAMTGYLGQAFDRMLRGEGDGSGEYERRLFRLGEYHEYTNCSDGTSFEGRIVGVSPVGLLRIEKRNGELKEFAFKEISYII